MRLLVINPNTNAATTARIGATARRVAGPEVTVEAVTAPFGAPGIATPAQVRVAEDAVAQVLAERAGTFDAAIIAAFIDPGLESAKAAHAVPVVGIAEAAMLEAAALGRFAIVTLALSLDAELKVLAARYGAAEALVAVRAMPWTIDEVSADPDAYVAPFRAACEAAVAELGVASIVLGGGPLTGIAASLDGALPVPLIDGTAAAVRRAMRLA
jgi:allantoin racemase